MATEKSMLNGQLLNLHQQLIDRKKELNDQEHVRFWHLWGQIGGEPVKKHPAVRCLLRAACRLHMLGAGPHSMLASL